MTQQIKMIDKNNILKIISQILKDCSDPKTKENGPKFFKEQIKLHGVKVATVTKISKEYFKYIKDYQKNDIFVLCEELWKSGYIEESFIACNWSYYMHENYSSSDFLIFEKWLKSYVNNWASCDTLCNHTIGKFIVKYPEYLLKLIKWTKSNNRWLRRGAAVTLIIPARNGKFLNDVLRIADQLLLDQDDLVQKGYGWMLKAASEFHKKELFHYVMRNKNKMPRTALRYAIEKMPKELKIEAMKK